MFKRKNKIVPEIKAKELMRSKAEADLNKFFKSTVLVKTDTKDYVTTFYSVPLKQKKCSIL